MVRLCAWVLGTGPWTERKVKNELYRDLWETIAEILLSTMGWSKGDERRKELERDTRIERVSRGSEHCPYTLGEVQKGQEKRWGPWMPATTVRCCSWEEDSRRVGTWEETSKPAVSSIYKRLTNRSSAWCFQKHAELTAHDDTGSAPDIAESSRLRHQYKEDVRSKNKARHSEKKEAKNINWFSPLPWFRFELWTQALVK